MKIHIQRAFGCSSQSYDASCDIQRIVAAELENYLPEKADSILEIGTGTGLFTGCLVKRYGGKNICCVDIAEPLLKKAKDAYPDCSYICADGENLPLDGQFSLVTGSSALQWFQNPSASLPALLDRLMPGGEFAFSVFAEGTFVEMAILKQMTGFGSVYPLPDAEAFTKYFGDCVTQSCVKEYILNFDSVQEFLKKQKGTGATFSGAEKFTSKTAYKKFIELYPELFGDGGKIPVTYRILYIKGVKK